MPTAFQWKQKLPLMFRKFAFRSVQISELVTWHLQKDAELFLCRQFGFSYCFHLSFQGLYSLCAGFLGRLRKTHQAAEWSQREAILRLVLEASSLPLPPVPSEGAEPELSISAPQASLPNPQEEAHSHHGFWHLLLVFYACPPLSLSAHLPLTSGGPLIGFESLLSFSLTNTILDIFIHIYTYGAFLVLCIQEAS